MKILIASSIHKDAIQKLEQEHDVICAFNAKDEELKAVIQDREVLIFRSGVQITADVMSHAPYLKLILRAGSGVDNIDINYVEEKGIRLVRIPGPGAKAVAELSFAFMLALSRNLLKADQLTRQGHFAKSQLTGYLLTGKTLGIIGVGNIGSRVAYLGSAWDMQVVGCVEFPTPSRVEEFRKQGVRLTDCKDVLQSCGLHQHPRPFESLHPLSHRRSSTLSCQAGGYPGEFGPGWGGGRVSTGGCLTGRPPTRRGPGCSRGRGRRQALTAGRPAQRYPHAAYWSRHL
jgi:hypothetical protein